MIGVKWGRHIYTAESAILPVQTSGEMHPVNPHGRYTYVYCAVNSAALNKHQDKLLVRYDIWLGWSLKVCLVIYREHNVCCNIEQAECSSSISSSINAALVLMHQYLYTCMYFYLRVLLCSV